MRPEEKRQNIWLIALLGVAALAIRALVLAASGPSVIRFGDAGSYLEAATTLCAERRYPWGSDLPFFRAPGLPFFIALVTGCRPQAIAVVKISLSVLDAGTVACTFLLARGLGVGAGASSLASALVAVDPLLIEASADVTTEPLATFLIAVWLVLVLAAFRDPDRLRPGLWLAGGLAGGLAALTRPAALSCVVLGVLAALMGHNRTLRGRLLGGLTHLLGAAWVIVPWALVASRAAGGLVVISDGAGYNLWRGMHPDLARATAMRDPETLLRESLRFQQETSPRVAAEVGRRASTLAGRSEEWQRLAFENLRADPQTAIVFLVRKTRVYWRPWPDRSVSATWLVLVGAAVLIPILGGGFLGLIQLARERPREAFFLGLVLAVPWMAQLPFQVAIRFRVPFGEVLLSVLAARFAGSIVSRSRSGQRR